VGRYDRQLRLVGGSGQETLKNSAVFIVGAGGIGNIAAKYLASSGVGKIIICDNDTIEESNLNRQILFNEESIGKYKSDTLCNTLNKINPDNCYVPIIGGIGESHIIDDTEFVRKHLFPHDNCVILDCTDNMKTSYVLEKIALDLNTPLVFAKTSQYFGVVTIIRYRPYLINNYPTKQLNKDKSVFPTIGGVVGSFQASLALKLILGLKTNDKVFHFDVLNDNFVQFDKI